MIQFFRNTFLPFLGSKFYFGLIHDLYNIKQKQNSEKSFFNDNKQLTMKKSLSVGLK